MNRTILDYGGVNVEREKVSDEFEPWSADARLHLAIAWGINKVKLRLFQENPANDTFVKEGIPL